MKGVIKFFCVIFIILMFFSIVLSAIQKVNAPVVSSGGTTGATGKLVNVEDGQSIIYYLKVLNKQLVGSNSNVSVNELQTISAEEAKKISGDEEKKFSPPGENSVVKVQNVFKLKTVKWTDVIPSQKTKIIFPEISINGDKHQLKIVFNERNLFGVRFVQVYDKEKLINCNSGFWSSAWNGLWLSKSMVFGWGEGVDTCEEIVGNSYILQIKVSGSSNKNITLTSTLIPESCPSIISQVDAGANYILTPAC
jgi:hypothetical protein